MPFAAFNFLSTNMISNAIKLDCENLMMWQKCHKCKIIAEIIYRALFSDDFYRSMFISIQPYESTPLYIFNMGDIGLNDWNSLYFSMYLGDKYSGD